MKNIKDNSDIEGIISFTLGIASALVYFISILLPISAIIFGTISLSKKKNKFAIIGLVLGVLFTIQYVNVNYLIPLFQNETGNSNSNSSVKVKTILSKAKSNGFECTDIECYKKEYTNTNILEEYTINTDDEYISKSFQMNLGNNQIMDVQARYGYNNGVLICASAFENPDNPYLINYRYNVTTGERSCNYSDMEKCSFNISIANDLVQYFNNMMK